MSTPLKVIIIVFGFILGGWIMGRVTGAFQFYSVTGSSNYPTLKEGGLFFTSNMFSPGRFRIICYKSETPEFGKQTWMHRLCGVQGDKVEIKNGQLYVNDKSVDEQFTLAYNYKIPVSELERVSQLPGVQEYMFTYLPNDTVMVCLAHEDVIKHNIPALRSILNASHDDPFIFEQFGKAWNQDNFGPVVVPPGKYFVLGDNRLYARDSRYTGFIDKEDVVGTVLWK